MEPDKLSRNVAKKLLLLAQKSAVLCYFAAEAFNRAQYISVVLLLLSVHSRPFSPALLQLGALFHKSTAR